MTSDGQTYERAAIELWLKDHNTSPNTGAILPHKILVKNEQLKVRTSLTIITKSYRNKLMSGWILRNPKNFKIVNS